MTVKIESQDNSCIVKIEGEMTIYGAREKKDVLISALKEFDQMEIDLSSVNEMDTAGLQVILLVKQTAEKLNKVVLLTAHSPASLDVIDRYNLAAHFGDPVVISSSTG